MKIMAKPLLANELCPFFEILGLRATVEADYNNRVFYVTPEPNQNSWGISFTMREGYSSIRPSDIGLSVGNKDGYVYWVSSLTRPATHDYTFDVTKDGVVTDTYRVIYII